MRREDFGPFVAAKTIARIEQGTVGRIRKNTLNAIAKQLDVNVEDIPSF